MKEELSIAIDRLENKLEIYDMPLEFRDKYKRQVVMLRDLLDAIS